MHCTGVIFPRNKLYGSDLEQGHMSTCVKELGINRYNLQEYCTVYDKGYSYYTSIHKAEIH